MSESRKPNVATSISVVFRDEVGAARVSVCMVVEVNANSLRIPWRAHEAKRGPGGAFMKCGRVFLSERLGAIFVTL